MYVCHLILHTFEIVLKTTFKIKIFSTQISHDSFGNHFTVTAFRQRLDYLNSLQKTVGKILVTLMSCSDSYFECYNISFYENKLNVVKLNPNGLDDMVLKNGQKILWFQQSVTDNSRSWESSEKEDNVYLSFI